MLDKSMSPGERFCLRFALGKMHDDCGRYDEAVAHYAQANIPQKKPYDIGDDETWLKLMQKLFTAESIGAFAADGNPTARSVFIVSMPRSGTTVMERIIASHADAAGADALVLSAREFVRIAIEPGRIETDELEHLAHARRDLGSGESRLERAQRFCDALTDRHARIRLASGS